MTHPTVTQADWDAAFAFERMVGGADTSLLSTCFARHRTATEASTAARIAALEAENGKLRELLARCNQQVSHGLLGDWHIALHEIRKIALTATEGEGA